MCTSGLPHVDYDNDRSLESVSRLRYFRFRRYYIYGQSGPSLLIESTDSIIIASVSTILVYSCYKYCDLIGQSRWYIPLVNSHILLVNSHIPLVIFN